MFKKTEPDDLRTEPTLKHSEPVPRPTRPRESATIGPSIRLNGDLSGDEDVVVQGQVEGTIQLRDNVLLVGKDGHINATVNARIINIEGRVEGDLHADEQVILQRSANVRGNIAAPRVTLEDGCKFKGSIDMDVEPSVTSKGTTEKIADFKPASTAPGETAPKSGLGSTGQTMSQNK